MAESLEKVELCLREFVLVECASLPPHYAVVTAHYRPKDVCVEGW